MIHPIMHPFMLPPIQSFCIPIQSCILSFATNPTKGNFMRTIKPFFRQVHLDFHTSEYIPGIGEKFDEKQFINALEIGHVDSINFFAQGHHGWCYYPTKIEGLQHPHLKTDLVGRMTKACREAGVNPVIYVTVGWNEKAAREHPEWCVRDPETGRFEGPEKLHPESPRKWGWYRLCLNTPYLEASVLPVTQEVLEMYHPAGIWYDITGEYECTCLWCVEGMRRQGLDPECKSDRQHYAHEVYVNYLKRTAELIKSFDPEVTYYHNSSDKKGRYDLYPYFTHYEIESLPTGGWGYDHFPTNAKYFTMLPDSSIVGMTGKFNGSWGEFGGFKSPTALRYEAAQIIALGCMACVGDQLHPNGVMDEETYRIIGEAYKDIEAREEWLIDAQPVADVAVLSPSAVTKQAKFGRASETGACSMLMEMHVPFVMIDDIMDFSPYKLILLPDCVPVHDDLAAKLAAYVDNGGMLIVTSESGLKPDKTAFALDLGVAYDGSSPWFWEYIKAGEPISKNMVTSPFLAFEAGVKTKLIDAEVLAETWQPYFNRTHSHFCSHQNTPPEKKAGWPSVSRKGNVIFIAQPIFNLYARKGMQLLRDLFANCLELLYGGPMLNIGGLPSCGRVSLMRQESRNRTILHVLYANPIKRGATEVIEDIVPIYDIHITLAAAHKPQKVYSAPEQKAIDFAHENGAVSFTIPRLEMSEMIVLEE
ncbi:MAG: beta-galactosidase [Chitinivibrionales bacterium]|nr:beta-galactosidase [Chitinivibrionales bacterium]